MKKTQNLHTTKFIPQPSNAGSFAILRYGINPELKASLKKQVRCVFGSSAQCNDHSWVIFEPQQHLRAIVILAAKEHGLAPVVSETVML